MTNNATLGKGRDRRGISTGQKFLAGLIERSCFGPDPRNDGVLVAVIARSQPGSRACGAR
jgi:hypothetical protein